MKTAQFAFGSFLLGSLCLACGCTGPGAFTANWSSPPQGALLEEVQKQTDPAARMRALDALAQRAARMEPARQAQVSAQLAAMLPQERDDFLRAKIIAALAAFPTESASSVIHAGLLDNSKMVRIACCEALGVRGGDASVEQLAKVVREEADIDVRIAAVEALSRIQSEKSVQALAVALEDSDPALQYRTIQALKQLTGRTYGNDVSLWREYLAGNDPQPKQPTLAERLGGWFWR